MVGNYYFILTENIPRNVKIFHYFSQVTKYSSPTLLLHNGYFTLVDHVTCRIPIHALPIAVGGSGWWVTVS